MKIKYEILIFFDKIYRRIFEMRVPNKELNVFYVEFMFPNVFHRSIKNLLDSFVRC